MSSDEVLKNILMENRADDIDFNVSLTELVTRIKNHLDDCPDKKFKHIPIGSILGVIDIEGQLYKIELQGRPISKQRAYELAQNSQS